MLITEGGGAHCSISARAKKYWGEPTEPPQSRRLCTEHVSHRCGELLSNVVIKLERTSVASHSADIIADIGVAL